MTKYQPINIEQALGYLVEECGEVLQAIGKTMRHGTRSSNPDLPLEKRELNKDWILREIKDLKQAIYYSEIYINNE